MARFLFVVPPFVGHLNPAASVAAALETEGHAVAWVAHPRTAAAVLPEGARIFPLDDDRADTCLLVAMDKALGATVAEDIRICWEEIFFPLARETIPVVEQAVQAFAPDVLVVDQQAHGGALVARKRGLPWASLATMPAGLTQPFLGLPELSDWYPTQLAALDREAGLSPVAVPDLSPHGVIVFSSQALVNQPAPTHVHFVGPALTHRAESAPFPFEALRPGKRVLVTLGTLNFDVSEPFYRLVTETFDGDDLQLVLVAPSDQLPRVPSNMLTRPFVPQLRLLTEMHAVVCHAGHNTTCEALALGLPLVVVPLRSDQPVVAQQVVDAGAGIRLDFHDLDPGALRTAVHRVLSEPSFREAAQRIQASFREGGGAPRAAQLLVDLARPPNSAR
ncbi:glycosyltransferase [Chondromyces crocatus]|uniref:Glycosyl transferase n=1 Tax=Chondromyces crocatus TaxID=52 RepID=A0A0K1E8K5_CHOCO|nr:nucleotide disphospho-sugar-binding domain-containing protein [Chondromyces crocatus]AKT36913.1 glycosyl transferase [Chondromyces crocatus]